MCILRIPSAPKKRCFVLFHCTIRFTSSSKKKQASETTTTKSSLNFPISFLFDYSSLNFANFLAAVLLQASEQNDFGAASKQPPVQRFMCEFIFLFDHSFRAWRMNDAYYFIPQFVNYQFTCISSFRIYDFHHHPPHTQHHLQSCHKSISNHFSRDIINITISASRSPPSIVIITCKQIFFGFENQFSK